MVETRRVAGPMTLTGNTTHIRTLRCFDRIGFAFAIAIGFCGFGAKGPALVNPGVSMAPAPNTPLWRETPDARPIWERTGEMGGYRRLTKEPFPSQGHFDGRWIAEVFANDLAATAYLKLPVQTAFQQGSVVVQTHAARVAGSPGPTFAMVKREPGYYPAGGDWEYVVTVAEGRIEDRGQIQLCARCHADGTSGWLFGLTPSAR
jgi:hypothetical protein